MPPRPERLAHGLRFIAGYQNFHSVSSTGERRKVKTHSMQTPVGSFSHLRLKKHFLHKRKCLTMDFANSSSVMFRMRSALVIGSYRSFRPSS
jgi:hypothetical protein